MGVPAFYRWLVDKYPKIVSDVIEAPPPGDGSAVDASAANPNGMEYDCLYLDMNGIIHPCARPEGRPPPATEEEMFVAIFSYIDRIFSAVRPRRLLFMAIDGPAPRAKMNQQRSRRFKAAKERADKEAEGAALRAELLSLGRTPPAEKPGPKFDSNVITPGTEFMDKLAKWLRYYVQLRIATTPGWSSLRVILSDASVPGEGEHKIMEHIRQQRALPGYEPNTRHCIHGLDADLIMLALSTHEPHFSILREMVLDRKAAEKRAEAIANGEDVGPPKLLFLHVWVLREYLHVEFAASNWSTVAGGFDLERVIDDFVYMCFFVGNDFLPHIPALEIKDGAIDMLIYAYKALLPKLAGYLSDAGRVHLPRSEILLREVASHEDEVFDRRRRREESMARAQAARAAADGTPPAAGAFGNLYPPKDAVSRQLHDAIKEFSQTVGDGKEGKEGKDGKATLPLPPNLSGFHKSCAHLYVQLFGLSETVVNGAIVVRQKSGKAEKRGGRGGTPALEPLEEGTGALVADFDERLALRLNQKDEAAAAADVDEVRFGEAGWKDRYYAAKLHVHRGEAPMKREVVRAYVEGLCWVLMYYYQGVQDWGWFYPFHYAPCASDLTNLQQFAGGKFELGKPFTPFQQLMAVFPPASGHALPAAYRKLMVLPTSPIIDFYPIDFRNDLNGKRFQWQAIALLPFIDAPRLRAACEPLTLTLTDEERARNVSPGTELIMTSSRNPMGKMLAEGADAEATVTLDSTSAQTPSFGGTVRPAGGRLCSPGGTLAAPPNGADYGLGPLPNCPVAGGVYSAPPYAKHVPRLLPTVVLPPPTLEAHDRPFTSRDSEHATRTMEYKFSRGGGGKGGGRGGGGGGRSGGRNGGGDAAQRMVHGALGVARR